MEKGRSVGSPAQPLEVALPLRLGRLDRAERNEGKRVGISLKAASAGVALSRG